MAFTLVGQPDHLSVHPGGVVIIPGPLTDVVPVQWAPKGFLITQFEHGDVEAIGLPKMDLLGIRALTVLSDTRGRGALIPASASTRFRWTIPRPPTCLREAIRLACSSANRMARSGRYVS